MRVGVVTLLVVWTVACGDDDVGGYADSGFSTPDAAFDAGCELPFYLASRDRSGDAGSEDAGSLPLTCEFRPGSIDDECATIDWSFAGGEQISLPGCCTTVGECGVLDPTGALGCVVRSVFGKESATCTADPNIDAGDDNDSGPPAT